MRHKLRRRSGFTLTETLITIAILALVTAAGTAGVTAVLAVRNRMIQLSNAQILASTAAEAIADELRFGRSITVAAFAPGRVTLDSTRFDTGSTLRLSHEDGTDTTPGAGSGPGKTVPAGRLVVERGAAPYTETREVLGASSYHDLRFSGLQFVLLTPATPTTDAAVQVVLTVADNSGQDLWTADFTVVPLNGASGTP